MTNSNNKRKEWDWVYLSHLGKLGDLVGQGTWGEDYISHHITHDEHDEATKGESELKMSVLKLKNEIDEEQMNYWGWFESKE